MDRPDFQSLAVVEVDAVKPDRQGFTLSGQGLDRAEYMLDLQFAMPLDPHTRTVLGELLSHSELTISRRTSAPSLAPTRNRALRRQNP